LVKNFFHEKCFGWIEYFWEEKKKRQMFLFSPAITPLTMLYAKQKKFILKFRKMFCFISYASDLDLEGMRSRAGTISD